MKNNKQLETLELIQQAKQICLNGYWYDVYITETVIQFRYALNILTFEPKEFTKKFFLIDNTLHTTQQNKTFTHIKMYVPCHVRTEFINAEYLVQYECSNTSEDVEKVGKMKLESKSVSFAYDKVKKLFSNKYKFVNILDVKQYSNIM